MILITGRAKLLPEHRDSLLAAAAEMRALTMTEAGCIDYSFWISAEDPDAMLLLEQWADQDSLNAHMGAPHMAPFVAALGPALDGELELIKHEVSSAGPLF